jgi:hypothetical protein
MSTRMPAAPVGTQLKAVIAAFAAAIALLLVVLSPTISQGTGILVTAMLAGSSWAFKQLDEEQRLRRNIASGYASAIRVHAREVEESLSDSELARFLALAPRIRSREEAPAWRGAKIDRFADLPDLKNHRHILNPETIEAVTEWKIRDVELHHVYDMLGTRQMAAISEERLRAYFGWVRQYRDAYLVIGKAAIEALEAEQKTGLFGWRG